jgi:hypothetical protein
MNVGISEICNKLIYGIRSPVSISIPEIYDFGSG